MNATVNALCYKSKTLSNGEHPLMIRICKDGKRKYKSLKISVNPKFWDFEKEKPKRNCPNREFIESVISNNIEQIRKDILQLNAESKEYTALTLIKEKETVINYSVGDFYKKLLQELSQSDKYGNWRIYSSSYNSIMAFTNGNLNIQFSEIDVYWLEKYEQWLINRGNIGTTISIQFRTLRAVFNKAISSKFVKKEYYPFDNYKINKFDTTTKKRAITKAEIKKVAQVEISNYKEKFAKDIFLFSYYCGGINFVDIALLKSENIIESKLTYTRHKTHKKICIILLDEAKQIFEKYAKDRTNNYIFPILDIQTHKNEKMRQIRIHNVLHMVDKQLKLIGEKTGIKTNLTTYVARHSFATILKNSGVNISIISEVLGHSDLTTTQIYLDSFEDNQINEAMKKLI